MRNEWFYVFDADDTLWKNQELFDFFVKLWTDMVIESGLDSEKATARLNELDQKCFHDGKFGNVYFLESMITVFREMILSDLQFELLRKKISAVHDDIFLKPPDVFPEVSDILKSLQQDAALYILTKGEYSTQQRKIYQSGLLPFFNGFIITAAKKTETYQKICQQYRINPAQAVMIGNSPRSDILPALEAGWWAVFFQKDLLWELESVSLPANQKMFIIRELNEIPGVISLIRKKVC